MAGQADMQAANAVCVGPQSEAAGKAVSCQGCPNAALCASTPKGPDPDAARITERMSGIRHKVLVLSGKGGVGKSTLTKELGLLIGRMGMQVGLMDTDICGPSLPRMLGARAEEIHASNDGWQPVGVDDNVSLVSIQFLLESKDEAVVFRGPRKNGMIKNFVRDVAWGELDLLLIDTPPGTSDEHLSIVSFLTQSGGCSGAIVITTPQEVAVADVRRELSFCRKAGVKVLGVVENMSGFVCPHCKGESQIFPRREGTALPAGERLAEEFAVPFLGRVPLDHALMTSCETGEPLVEHPLAGADPAARPPSLAALEGVARQLLRQLGAEPAQPMAQ
eukprot:TRINITY_DN60027_c0_g1_i1.p1 TRINITY_DN60027_c0_g1~~TRINITY_DN60027_c0_g1_i1.p1  ORF type:complete len:334 (+),score=110.83 TRINITY_DN60027_c0_g1_i1:91-1092(+)